VLEGEVGKRLVIARRSGQDWFIAGLTDNTPRTESVDLSFLKKGQWRLRLWKDANDSGVNAEHLDTEERVVKPSERVKIELAPAGGFVGWLRRQ
jgi:alpha-glucosidase